MMKILIVDDSNMMRSILKSFILKAGAAVEILETDNAREAIAKSEQFHPDLIFLDLSLAGGMNGLEAVEKIRKSDPDTRIIVCSADTEHLMPDKGVTAGIQGFISKPFNSLQVMDAVKSILSETMNRN